MVVHGGAAFEPMGIVHSCIDSPHEALDYPGIRLLVAPDHRTQAADNGVAVGEWGVRSFVMQ
jgi:hypothetical protein